MMTRRATYKHLVGAFVVVAIDTKQSPQDFPEQKLLFEVEEPISHVQRFWLKVDASLNM